MQKPTRRNLLKGFAATGVAAGLGVAIRHSTAEGAPQDVQQLQTESQGHGHFPAPSGPMASGTVSFGQWTTDPYVVDGKPVAALDRFTVGSPRQANIHLLIPYEATITAGGSVNFMIAGFHLVTIYDDGHRPEDVNPGPLIPGTLQFIDDSDRRIYRGLDPSMLGAVQDRVEVVQFTRPGRFLVICGFRPHFVNDNMHGYVRVLP